MSKHERTKSGGGSFIGTLLGRPSKVKGRNATLNGGRPISAESDSLDDGQELNNDVDRWTMDEVNDRFIDILEDMNIPRDKLQPLLEKSVEEKRSMIVMHLKGSYNRLFF